MNFETLSEVNKKGLPHGKETLTLHDGKIVKGEFKNGEFVK